MLQENAQSLAYAFEKHWNGLMCELEEKAVKTAKFFRDGGDGGAKWGQSARGEAGFGGGSSRGFPRPQFTPARGAPQGTPILHRELKKKFIEAYRGPACPEDVCRIWWYDGDCRRSACHFAASHVDANKGKGDA